MGYGLIPDIKNEDVVCQQPCQHEDCEANRKMWGSATCVTCSKPMEPGQAFYFDDNGKPEHAHCAWDRLNPGSAK